ncbi:MAG: class E sortase [Rubrobacteraceae bacterium]|nr:class E sortase [Rubrobacteraceae bacterium]
MHGRRRERRIFTRRRRRRTGLGLLLMLVLVAVAGVVAFGLNVPGHDTGQKPSPKGENTQASVKPAKGDAPRSQARTASEAGGGKTTPRTSGRKSKPQAKERAAKKPSHPVKRKEARASRGSVCGPTPPKPPNDALYLTVPKLDIYGDTVTNSDSEAALNQGAIKLPPTGFPWQPCANTYIVGHRIGYAGTQSYYQFYNLPSMQPGDEIILTDANGTRYIYRVTRVFAVGPYDTRYTYPVPGKNLVTLQTCITSLNDWWTIGPAMYNDSPNLDRLLVQGERVAIEPGSPR